jgi:HSP20 family molecular chaperone IbpA
MDDIRRSSIRILYPRLPYALFDLRPWTPPTNVFETEQAMVIVAELAGVDPASLRIDAHPTFVSIQGTRQLALPARLRRLHRMEIASGPFQIEVPFDRPIDPDAATARALNGLLEVWLPFAGQTEQRVVVIQVSEGGGQ